MLEISNLQQTNYIYPWLTPLGSIFASCCGGAGSGILPIAGLEGVPATDGLTTSYEYDANNNLITLTDGKGNARQWFYEERNLNRTKAYPGNSGADFYSQNFDALGRVKIKVDQAGTTVSMIYDLAGRLTEKQYHTGATPASDPEQTVVITQGPTLESTDTFSYDAASRITETFKGRHGITTSHTYAADSQPLTETVTADTRTYTMSRSYDSGNRPLTHTYPDGKVTTWAYSARNLVDTVHYEDKHILTNTHDAAYRLTNETLGNGLTRTINYGRQDNLRTSDTTFDGIQALDDLAFSYSYAADKQITAESIVGDVVQNTSFTASYDAGNRITNWNRAGAPSNNAQTWNYDDAGNWNSTTKDGTTTENRNHSVSDQITSIAGNAAAHDAKGNLTEYEINSKEYEVNYDLDNRIIKVDVNNDDVEYRYDALGRRVIRKEGSTNTALIWWGNSECAEYEHGAGQSCIQNDIMSHPVALNAVIARAVDGSKFDLEWYHKNYLDHVYAVSDDSGDLNEHYRYTAFGEVTIYNGSGTIQSSTQINNTITWNTRRLDKVSGYYLYKYRHYDPALGRWPGRDPIEESGGVNLYAFVGNDPVASWDKLGYVPTTYIFPDPMLVPIVDVEWSSEHSFARRERTGRGRGPFPREESRRWGYLGLTTYPHRYVSCWCKNCKIECEVGFSALIEINIAHKQYTIGKRPGIISHERRHVMSRAMGIAERVVDPLLAVPVVIYDDNEACAAASIKLMEDYEEILNDYLDKHKNHVGDSGDNKWSPKAKELYPDVTQEEIEDWMFNDV